MRKGTEHLLSDNPSIYKISQLSRVKDILSPVYQLIRKVSKKTLPLSRYWIHPPHRLFLRKDSFDLTIVTKDAKTGTFIGGVQIYLDGGSVGSTLEKEGKRSLSEVQKGRHTIRVTKTGFKEITRSVDISEKKQISFNLDLSNVIPVQIHGPTDDKIDIVFVASKTSFNCKSKTKIQTEVYTGDQQRFVMDVNNKVENVFFKLDTLTSGFVGLPKDFRERFNFYYYWDNENFGDAFEGCAGTLPVEFWNDAPFTDVAIIMYPSYEGFYSGAPCEPIGCANGLGPGSGSWLKAPV